MIEYSWRAFGELFGRHLSSLGTHLESLVHSKATLGLLLEALGRVLEPKEAHLAPQSAIWSSTWRPKALQDANLAV